MLTDELRHFGSLRASSRRRATGIIKSVSQLRMINDDDRAAIISALAMIPTPEEVRPQFEGK